MHALKKYLGSSIGRKQLMGATGLMMYLFLLAHLVGNLGIFGGAERYNQYGYLLLHTLKELVIPAELGLIAAFIIHVVLAIKLTKENRAARPIAYAVTPNQGKRTLYSVTMMITGLAILAFILVHIAHFRFGKVTGHTMVTYNGVEMRDLYGTLMQAFSHWWYALTYVVVFLLLASHLAHGVQSSLQTLGFNHPKYTPAVKWLGRAYALSITGGFCLLAIWSYLQHGGTP
jgi:succinate dehydrogenase / fumarate reductase, cytochrome b subunit